MGKINQVIITTDDTCKEIIYPNKDKCPNVVAINVRTAFLDPYGHHCFNQFDQGRTFYVERETCEKLGFFQSSKKIETQSDTDELRETLRRVIEMLGFAPTE